MVPTYSPERLKASSNIRHHAFPLRCIWRRPSGHEKVERFKRTRINCRERSINRYWALLHNPGEIVTREELRTSCCRRTLTSTTDATYDTTLNKLRWLLGDSHGAASPHWKPCSAAKANLYRQDFVVRRSSAGVLVARLQRLIAGDGEVAEHAAGKPSVLRTALLSRWFAAGVVTLVIVTFCVARRWCLRAPLILARISRSHRANFDESRYGRPARLGCGQLAPCVVSPSGFFFLSSRGIVRVFFR